MGVLNNNIQKNETTPQEKKVRKKVVRIKLEFDKELEALSGTILFPEKLALANRFLSKSK